jgi:hypothetical protein
MGDHEVLRAIYGTLRDESWNTLVPRITNLEMDCQPHEFRIRFEAQAKKGAIDFSWSNSISGSATGQILYEFKGTANSDFLKNRIGLGVLHPISECAGKPCVIERVDGTTEEGLFPRHISPDPPFRHIRAITHEAAPGVNAEVRLEGDAFEMEDQRNWTDASFKTYAPPLDQPYPVGVKAGDIIEQSVTLQLPGQPRKILPILQGRGAQFSIATTPVLPKPALGLGFASQEPPLTDLGIARLAILGLSHLRVDLKLESPDWKDTLARAAHETNALKIGLQVALHPGRLAEDVFGELALELEKTKPSITLWQLVGDLSDPHLSQLLKAAQTHLGLYNSNALFALGSDATFGELNRHRPAPDQSALPCFPIHPQHHAFDHLTLMENIAAQPVTVETLQQFAPRAGVISSITLGPRKPVSSTPAGENSTPSDPRQRSLLGAGWTLASLGRLGTGGNLHSLTYFETTGLHGVMGPAGKSTSLQAESSDCEMVYPVYHVLADLAGFSRLLPTLSSHPLQTEAMTLIDSRNKRRILVANLSDTEQDLRIKSGSCTAQVRYLDESNAESAMRDPESYRNQPGECIQARAGKLAILLKPYALARVDID